MGIRLLPRRCSGGLRLALVLPDPLGMDRATAAQRETDSPARRLLALINNPKIVAEIDDNEVPNLILGIAGLLTALSSRTQRHQTDSDDDPDTLLDVSAAAERLCVSRDWIYRHGKRLPFAVRIGRKHLRFSATGLDRWLQTRQGR